MVYFKAQAEKNYEYIVMPESTEIFKKKLLFEQFDQQNKYGRRELILDCSK